MAPSLCRFARGIFSLQWPLALWMMPLRPRLRFLLMAATVQNGHGVGVASDPSITVAPRRTNPLRCRIGINTGFCRVGNFGSADRMDYTIIGSGVNLASRLESASAPGEILISYETYALVKDEILCSKFGEITVKGISHPVETYKVVDTYEKLGREREVIHDEFPNYSLTIKLEALSADERSRAVASLSRALDKLDQREDVAVDPAA